MDNIEMKPIDDNEASTANASEAADNATTTGAAPNLLRKPSEPTSEVLHNFAQVTLKQLAHIVFPPKNRFQPVHAVARSQTQTHSSSSSSSSSTPVMGKVMDQLANLACVTGSTKHKPLKLFGPPSSPRAPSTTSHQALPSRSTT
jgi:hypothetical protein